MANTVSLCMICKNEKSNIGFLMDDVCPVLEEVHVTDTGSTDGTLDILKEKQKIYKNLYVHHFDWVDHFSEARNFSFTKAGNVDWIFWVDSDDRVNQNDLKYFKDNVLDNASVDCWLLPYIYSKYPDGRPQTYLTRERFLRKSKKPIWVGAIHETVAIHNLRHGNYENLKIEHNRDGKFIEPKRNLKILEKEFEKNPKDPRTAYYYAKELFDYIDPKAKEQLIHYLSLDGKYWDDEIGARFRLARQYLSENKYREAIQTIEFVYHLDSSRRRSEYYFIYGEVEQRLGNYDIAIDWYKRCLYNPPGPPRVLSLEFWTWNPLKQIAECYRKMGKWDEAFEYANRVSQVLPGDETVVSWINSFYAQTLNPKIDTGLTVLEFGTNLRNDSYKVGKDYYRVSLGKNSYSDLNWFFTKQIPFAEGCIDGIVLDTSLFPDLPLSELARVIKPQGFLWCVKNGKNSLNFNEKLLFNNLGFAKYKNIDVCNHIRVDDKKPSVGYRDLPAAKEYGSYRYRIFNLIMSAKKNGYPVYDVLSKPIEVDIYVDMNMEKRHGKINVLEFCEKLDSYGCHVQNADVLDASSFLLAEHLRKMYPDKKVINVDDHFEIPAESWL